MLRFCLGMFLASVAGEGGLHVMLATPEYEEC
jgi:hypothetical protein